MAALPVLIVDDDGDTRMSLRALFEDIGGYGVAEADTIAAALALLAAPGARYVVLFDYVLPDADGGTLLERITAEPALAGRHAFVCMSASPRLAETHHATPLARFDIALIAKPFDIDAMLAAVERAEASLLAGSLATGSRNRLPQTRRRIAGVAKPPGTSS